MAQPVKPYLRYRNMKNRIIAMPAFVGGDTAMAGIKWIASFPGNADRGLQRAHSVTILNEADTGVPLCIFNTALISGIRTAAVSAVVLKDWLRPPDTGKPLRVGMTGFGPIGQLHLQMLACIAVGYALEVRVYDPRGIDLRLVPAAIRDVVTVCDSWETAYVDADIFMACTVASKPYINLPPKVGSLQMNISLRDYVPELRASVDMMIVDDWEEVCRENTDIENMHRAGLLREEEVLSLADVVSEGLLEKRASGNVVMFNPMGMAIFDIAIASHYYHTAIRQEKGVLLED
jgi:ornithine cyclodeaminase